MKSFFSARQRRQLIAGRERPGVPVLESLLNPQKSVDEFLSRYTNRCTFPQ